MDLQNIIKYLRVKTIPTFSKEKKMLHYLEKKV